MKKLNRIILISLSVILFLFFILSLVDTMESNKKTNFEQDNIMTHVEKLSENGPRSILHKEANQKAVDYIVEQLESYGITLGDSTTTASYVVQEFVAEDSRYQNWYLENVIVHIPGNSSTKTNEAIMFMGHLDSVPMGDGASDDGVAIAVMLEACRYYMEKIEEGFTLSNDLVFAFVNGEEYGMYGSKAFVNEFNGFNNLLDRIKFVTNLESRGSRGTVIMFETAANNYNTIKLFSSVNESIFTCSIATLVYDMMPNYTDFTPFKEAFQGLNMANVSGGENYHTQNDNFENVGSVYVSQQAHIVDSLIGKLANYRLQDLYEAEESAIFFSYLNVTTVIYKHIFAYILAIIGIALMVLNILLSKESRLVKTSKGILVLVSGLALTAAVTLVGYYVFQYVAVLFNVIDINMVGTITYSNMAIVISIGVIALAVTSLTAYFGTKLLKISYSDVRRAFAYTHMFLGVVLSFVLTDVSYLFMLSGLLLVINEVLISYIKKVDIEKYHLELLVTALYFPIIIPVINLATSALGMTMSYVYGLVFALAIFDIALVIAPVLKYVSIVALVQKVKKVEVKTCPVLGFVHIMAPALITLFIVSTIKLNCSVNLQGKQNIVKLPYDDALVYVIDEFDNREYRIYDLNAYYELKDYAPSMEYLEEYYVGYGDSVVVEDSIKSTFNNNQLVVDKINTKSIVYLEFTNATATSFTLTDGITTQEYTITDGTYSIKIHSNCTVTLNGGSADVLYKEVIIDYETLIPNGYNGNAHFNLWLTKNINLG